MPLEITERKSAKGVKVQVAGEMTLSGVAPLQAALLRLADRTSVTLDLAKATCLDLACLQLLLSARLSYARRGVPLRILDSAGGLWKREMAAAGIPEPPGGLK